MVVLMSASTVLAVCYPDNENPCNGNFDYDCDVDGAIGDCNGLANGECGLTDGFSGGNWRLPNLFELESLRDMKYWEPALSNSASTGQWTHGDPFINLVTPVNSSFYWSSTTYAKDGDGAFYINMYHGGVSVNGKSSGLGLIWPVRGGH
jgi:hypothetical protein